jgi:hypothetical protein
VPRLRHHHQRLLLLPHSARLRRNPATIEVFQAQR